MKKKVPAERALDALLPTHRLHCALLPPPSAPPSALPSSIVCHLPPMSETHRRVTVERLQDPAGPPAISTAMAPSTPVQIASVSPRGDFSPCGVSASRGPFHQQEPHYPVGPACLKQCLACSGRNLQCCCQPGAAETGGVGQGSCSPGRPAGFRPISCNPVDAGVRWTRSLYILQLVAPRKQACLASVICGRLAGLSQGWRDVAHWPGHLTWLGLVQDLTPAQVGLMGADVSELLPR